MNPNHPYSLTDYHPKASKTEHEATVNANQSMFHFKMRIYTTVSLLLGYFFCAAIPKVFGDDAQSERIQARLKALPMNAKVKLSDDEWRKILTSAEFHVLRRSGTERPYKNEYWNNRQSGIYLCAACGNQLFGSDTKFESHTGWPSFYAPLATRRYW